MGHRGIPLLGVLCCFLQGCFSSQAIPSKSWLQSWRPLHGPSVARVIQLETYLVEGSAGDAYLNQELWSLTDDQVLRLEQKALLEDNGFRFGQIGGFTPNGLQSLLTSEKSCANPRRIQTHAESPTRLSLGPILAHCQFDILQEEHKVTLQLDHAECGLVVVPSLTSDGRIHLKFTPEVRHSKQPVMPQPIEQTTWVFQKQQAIESFSQLSWDVTLAANESVVLGGRFDRPDTLGHQCFVRLNETNPKQRLLVIRTALPPTGGAPDASPADADEETAAHLAPPLALQAAWTRIRGSAP